MITITLRLSESLLSIFRDTGSPRPETYEVQVAPGTPVGRILAAQGISPLLVPMVALETDGKQQRIDMHTPLKADGVVTLYGPLAGG